MRDSVTDERSDVVATRDGYDAMAERYVAFVAGLMDRQPFDRAMLRVFADVVRGPVVEVGCGPGRITAHLDALGVEVSGIDLSSEMIRLARAAYPGLSFEVAAMESLDLPDRSLGGIVAWYSIIHTPPEHVPAILSKFARALTAGGHLLLAFQTVDEPVTVVAREHTVARAYWWSVPGLEEMLHDNGFSTVARMTRAADPDEKGPQGYLLATKAR
ncbi:class I SAM-dependent DNA methyltransferase [Nocardia gipuzkoensis]